MKKKAKAGRARPFPPKGGAQDSASVYASKDFACDYCSAGTALFFVEHDGQRSYYCETCADGRAYVPVSDCTYSEQEQFDSDGEYLGNYCQMGVQDRCKECSRYEYLMPLIRRG